MAPAVNETPLEVQQEADRVAHEAVTGRDVFDMVDAQDDRAAWVPIPVAQGIRLYR